MIDSIENIIERCRRKDPKAQRLLYENYSARMFGVCMRYSNSKEDAEDVLHEGFIKIFEKIFQFESRGSFEGWMRRIMVNTALEKFRNQHRVINIQDNFDEPEHDDYDVIVDNLTSEELLKLIQALSPKYKMVFNLYAIEGFSHKEISTMLNISEGTSKSNLSRARLILQEKVHKFYNQSIRVSSSV